MYRMRRLPIWSLKCELSMLIEQWPAISSLTIKTWLVTRCSIMITHHFRTCIIRLLCFSFDSTFIVCLRVSAHRYSTNQPISHISTLSIDLQHLIYQLPNHIRRHWISRHTHFSISSVNLPCFKRCTHFSVQMVYDFDVDVYGYFDRLRRCELCAVSVAISDTMVRSVCTIEQWCTR